MFTLRYILWKKKITSISYILCLEEEKKEENSLNNRNGNIKQCNTNGLSLHVFESSKQRSLAEEKKKRTWLICGNSKWSTRSIEIYVRCILVPHTHISISMAHRQNKNTLGIKKITGVDKSKKTWLMCPNSKLSACSQNENTLVIKKITHTFQKYKSNNSYIETVRRSYF